MTIWRRMAMGVLFLSVFLVPEPAPVQAANFLGEFCWQAGSGGLARFAVTDMGGGHFLLNGRLIGEVVEPAHGNGEVVGSNVLLTIVSMGADASDVWGSFARVVLDLPSLNGSVEVIDVNHSKASPNPSNAQASYNGAQALTFVACP